MEANVNGVLMGKQATQMFPAALSLSELRREEKMTVFFFFSSVVDELLNYIPEANFIEIHRHDSPRMTFSSSFLLQSHNVMCVCVLYVYIFSEGVSE